LPTVEKRYPFVGACLVCGERFVAIALSDFPVDALAGSNTMLSMAHENCRACGAEGDFVLL
jgi:hypothetical protein